MEQSVVTLFACLFLRVGPAMTDCPQVLESGLSYIQKNELVETHNYFRSLIAMGKVDGQPGAADMQEMGWNDNLADLAQAWAETCKFGHDPKIKGLNIGQNLYIKYGYELQFPIFRDFVETWFNEHKNYSFGSSFKAGTGHYTQIIWSNTTMLGCGYIMYKTSDNLMAESQYLVCNYSPAGNIVNRNPYREGMPNCPALKMAQSIRHDGLCEHPGTTIEIDE